MQHAKKLLIALAVVTASLMAGSKAEAHHYYSSWNYYPSYSYYYSYCYYQPTYDSSYDYHYTIYYPSYPRYVYYYNPHSRRYWGRYDLEAKGYSMLAENDRKEKLSDIPESAFPKPGDLPQIPGAADGTKLTAPPALPANPKK